MIMTISSTKSLSNHTKAFNLSISNAWLLLGCQFLNLSTLMLQLSTWMIAIILLCLGWQVLLLNNRIQINKNSTNRYSARTKQLKVSSVILILIAISGCVVIALSANSQGVLLSMLHLLTFAYTLKAFEIKQRKDFYQIILLGLFVLASALIFIQSLSFSILIFTIFIVNLTLLHRVFSPHKSVFSASKTVFILILQSALLAVVLFIVFPRLSPFWQVPSATSATTGLSDEVSPGDIASLALSSDLAFRVDFKGKDIPSYSQLYWRAMTLEHFDGKKWTRKKEDKITPLIDESTNREPFKPKTFGDSVLYDVIVEPSFQSWLFGLSVITSSDPKLTLLDDYTVRSLNVITQVSQYQLKSYLNSPLDLTISEYDKQRNLTIVKGSNPRLEQLAENLKKQYIKPIDRAQAILNTFRESNYFYTLQAPKLVNNSLDQFYFNTKSGFCVHYASSFTYLMRAAGIPARIVTGYLGGEFNNVNIENDPSQINQKGGHLSIYQYDAHAWSEIWLPNVGWKRIDPTAAVDPERVESGWSNALLTQQFSLNNDLISLYQFKNNAWLNQLRLQLDAIDYQWTHWVLGYSSQKQYDLLKQWFGENIPWKIAIIVIIICSFIMGIATLLYRVKLDWFSKKEVSPWLSIYQKLLKKIAVKGLVKPENMSTMAYASLVANKLPQISEKFNQFTVTFEQLNYKKLNRSEQLLLLKKLKIEYKSIVATLH